VAVVAIPAVFDGEGEVVQLRAIVALELDLDFVIANLIECVHADIGSCFRPMHHFDVVPSLTVCIVTAGSIMIVGSAVTAGSIFVTGLCINTRFTVHAFQDGVIVVVTFIGSEMGVPKLRRQVGHRFPVMGHGTGQGELFVDAVVIGRDVESYQIVGRSVR
jgi:hypothetical protein